MGIVAILFNGANTHSIEGPMWNLEKIGQTVWEKFKDYIISYMYIAQGQRQIAPRDKILIVTKMVYYFNQTL